VRNAQQLMPFWAPNDIIRYTTKGLLDIAAQHATMEEVDRPPPVLGNRGAVPGSSKAAPSGFTVQGIKGGKKRRKQRPQWVAAAANYNDDDDKKTDDSDMDYVMTIGRSVKCQAWPPKDHFERLLKEAFANHAYLIKHKLNDYDMIKNLMTLGPSPGTRNPRKTREEETRYPFLRKRRS
jgi:hypothetical protein